MEKLYGAKHVQTSSVEIFKAASGSQEKIIV